MPRTPRSGPAQLDSRAVNRLVERSARHGAQALYCDPSLYERLYARRTDDIDFYVAEAQRICTPVLELGAGSGRVTVALARAGISVTAVDAMPSMLAQARARISDLPAKVRTRIALKRADIRSVRLGKRFALVIAPFNVFSHLYTRRDLERALQTCRAHLAPKGRLVFDVVMPDLAALAQDPGRVYRCGSITDPQSGRPVSYSEASHYDAVRQTRSMTLLLGKKGSDEHERAIPLTHRQYFPAELEALLHYNGFESIHRFGDFAGGPLTDQSRSQIIVAEPRRR